MARERPTLSSKVRVFRLGIDKNTARVVPLALVSVTLMRTVTCSLPRRVGVTLSLTQRALPLFCGLVRQSQALSEPEPLVCELHVGFSV